jgi:hypothetical protein
MSKICAALGIILLVASIAAIACTPATPSASHIARSSIVAYGIAVSDHWDQSSTSLRVGVDVKHARKGNAPSSVEALSPCALPIKIGETVVVFMIGDDWVVYPADMYKNVLGSTPARSANSSFKPMPLRGTP